MSTAQGYKNYWIIWAVLLVVTLTMIFIGESNISTAIRAGFLLLGSTIKASLIIFYFMHLKFERFGLILTVLVGIFVTSFLMFMFPAYDSSQIGQRVMFP